MIQFNLLPDVKKEYVKAKRTKRLLIVASSIVSLVSIAVVLLLFSIVQVAQKKHISDLTKDIQAEAAKIQQTENLNTILSVQNQLSLLPVLHQQKPEMSRIFDYMVFVSPVPVKVSTLNLSAEESSLTLQGYADTLATVNKFVDNLKAVTYVVEGSEESATKVYPFTQIATQLAADNEKATFKIDITYDPLIFDNTKEIVFQLGDQSYTTKPKESQ